MQAWTIWIIMTVEILIAGGILLMIPKVTRRGLLFGVYVGEQRSAGDEARRITRNWYTTMIAALVGAIGIGAVLAALTPHRPLAVMGSLIVLIVAATASYLRAHFASRGLAAPGPPPAAAALVVDQPASLAVPLAATIVAVVGGVIAVGYSWWHYDAMPAIIPTHFGPSGRPDAWSPRSFRSVMMLPLLTAFVAPAMGLIACLTARAKRAIRQADGGVSLDAQLRFRRAFTLFLSGIAILVTIMLVTMSVMSVRVALGLSEGLPAATLVIGGALAVLAIGGSLYLMFHFGQGGARLERRAAGAPLTNGLADNTHWVLGMFYVNRDDPSMLVEKRFGVGYTLNFGNPKAVALLTVFVAILLLVFGVSIAMPQSTSVPGR
jgi:uncharacterized membrane protein